MLREDMAYLERACLRNKFCISDIESNNFTFLKNLASSNFSIGTIALFCENDII